MRYIWHILFGALLSTLMYVALLYLDVIINIDLFTGIILVIIYSILPDIDIKDSKIRKIVMPLLIILIIISYFIEYYVLCLSLILMFIFILLLKHRTITHTIWFAFIISIPFYQNIGYFVIAFVSYASHLVLDRL